MPCGPNRGAATTLGAAKQSIPSVLERIGRIGRRICRIGHSEAFDAAARKSIQIETEKGPAAGRYCFTNETGTWMTALPPSGASNWAAWARA